MFETFLAEGVNQNVYIFYLINGTMENSFFNFIMPLITSFGGFFGWAFICLLFYLFGGRFGREVAVLGLVALILSNVLVIVLKFIIAEPRPFMTLPNVDLLTPASGTSFPSGHTATSFAAAALIGLRYHRKTKEKKHLLIYPLLVVAVVVGYSRVYVGVHYPYDVISGAFIGILCAILILYFENNILYSKTSFTIRLDKVLAFSPLGTLKKVLKK